MSWQQKVMVLVAVVLVVICGWCGGGSVEKGKEELDVSTVDVSELATRVYGTELFLLENSYKDQTTYRLEDFFWTGSGDGSDEEDNHWTSENPTLIYKTKTVYIESPHSLPNETNHIPSKCTDNCSIPQIPEGEISPTPPLKYPTTTEEIDGKEEDFFHADRQFWLLTVLKSDGKDPIITDLKNSLAKLYKIAFERHQERHLGINGRIKREIEDKTVNVYIHNLNKTKLNGDEKIQVLYHVSVDGKPVSAVTAANDMNFVSDEEVMRELGYPFLIKAEPYLKPSEPQSLTKAKNTWIFIGVSIIALLIFLLVVAFLTLGLTKKKRISTPVKIGTENRKHIFERGVGTENKGFVQDENSRRKTNSPTYINYRNEHSRSAIAISRPESSISSMSSSSSSLEISPLMGLDKKHRTPPKKPPRPKAAFNKTLPVTTRQISSEIFESDSSNSRKESPIYAGVYNTGVVSPKSYLSMPSVKSFPRGSMPEPLSKVLEPVSLMHLDMPAEEIDVRSRGYLLTRHGSVGAVEDPGVIGPIVWSMHNERLQHGVSMDEGMDDLKVSSNISKMRKRFHDLLDDTFSLFGSRRASPTEKPDSRSIPIEVKSHSAADTRSEDLKAPTPKPRPKTTDFRRSDLGRGSGKPKGAWSSKAPSPLVRPLSSGIIRPQQPKVNIEHVLAEGKFKAEDPAETLIAAIKSEIERVSLPGSTADLRD